MSSVKWAVCLFVGGLCGFVLGKTIATTPLPAASLHAIPPVEMVRNLSELTTLRVDLADVELTQISGWSGGVEAALVVKGDFAIGTDLGRARFIRVDPRERTATVLLPAPTASPPRLDHNRSQIVLVRETGLWRMLPGDEAFVAVSNAAYRDAQKALSATSNQSGHQQAARRQAEHVVQTFFTGIGWSVTVQWS